MLRNRIGSYDGSLQVGVYLDGQEETLGSSAACTIDTDNTNGTDLRIGMTDWSGHEAHFDGLVDDVRLYSRDLSDAEIASLAAYHQQAFTYDRLGNRLTLTEPRNDSTTTYTYTAANEIATINGSQTTYDNAGNLTDDTTYDYYYDHENRLTCVADASGALADYTYDALGRRIQTIANSTTTRYYYDNWRVLAETDDQAAIQRVYVYGNYLDEALLMIDKTGQSDVDYYYVHDHLFSPMALLESDGDVAERYEYDAYGEPRFYDKDFVLLATQSSGYGNPIMFTGQRLDRLDTGDLLLMNYKARVYDPGTGRFLQHDPIGYADGMSLYQYVRSNPVGWGDPLGLMGQQERRDLAIQALRVIDRNYTGDSGYLFYIMTGLQQAINFRLIPALRWVSKWSAYKGAAAASYDPKKNKMSININADDLTARISGEIAAWKVFHEAVHAYNAQKKRWSDDSFLSVWHDESLAHTAQYMGQAVGDLRWVEDKIQDIIRNGSSQGDIETLRRRWRRAWSGINSVVGMEVVLPKWATKSYRKYIPKGGLVVTSIDVARVGNEKYLGFKISCEELAAAYTRKLRRVYPCVEFICEPTNGHPYSEISVPPPYLLPVFK